MPTSIFLVPMKGTGTKPDPFTYKYAVSTTDATTTTSSGSGDVVPVNDSSVFAVGDIITVGSNKPNRVIAIAAQEITIQLRPEQIEGHPQFAGVPTWAENDGLRHKTSYEGIRYSRTDTALVGITTNQWYLDFIEAQVDTTLLATDQNLDSVLTIGQANAAKTIFDAEFIPSEFVNVGETRREVIRKVSGLFLFSQRVEHVFGEGWKRRAQNQSITLNSTYSSFPQQLKDEFKNMRDDHGWDNLGIVASSTMREILLAVSNNFSKKTLHFSGITISWPT